MPKRDQTPSGERPTAAAGPDPGVPSGRAQTGPGAPGADRMDRFWRVRHLPVLLGVSAVLAALGAVVGAITGGGAAALGLGIGVAIVTVSYTLSTVVLAWADSVDPQLVLTFGLALYATKFTLLGVLMVAVAATGWPGLVPLCLGIVAGVVAWTGAHIWWITAVHGRRTRPRLPA